MEDDVVAHVMRGELSPGTSDFDLLIDRTARRPSGEEATAHYRVAQEHQKDFDLAMRALELQAEDRFLEIGFGGGQLLERALGVVSAAAGIDHSADMLALASERNVRAIVNGRLQLVFGDAANLPWPHGAFTAAAAVNIFFFLEEPQRVLRELHRVLGPGGKLVIVTVPPEHAGSGPWSAALHTYQPAELESMIGAAGFVDVKVDEREERQLARARRLATP